MPVDQMKIEKIERAHALRVILGMIEKLEPGQSVRIDAHDPDQQVDSRWFTIHLLKQE